MSLGLFDIKEEDHVYFETDKNFIFENAKPKEGYTYGLYRCKGGTFRVYIKASEGVLEDIFINGDYIISPKDYIKSLENFLKGKKIDIIKDELDLFLESRAFRNRYIKRTYKRSGFVYNKKARCKRFWFKRRYTYCKYRRRFKRKPSKGKGDAASLLCQTKMV